MTAFFVLMETSSKMGGGNRAAVLISDTWYVCDLDFTDSGFFSHCSSFPLFFFWFVMDLSFILMLSLIRFQKCFEICCALAINHPLVTHVRSFTGFGRNLLGFSRLLFLSAGACVVCLEIRGTELSLFGYR
jgi:hypothetical protein